MFPSELIPCLMVALPLVGAVLVLLSAPTNPEQARWTALTNVLLTLVLSLLLVSRYNVPELLPPNADDVDRRELVTQTLQMGRAFPWLTPRDRKSTRLNSSHSSVSRMPSSA